MRITQSMISRNLLSTVTKNRERASELELDMATTRRIRRPSDDPSAVVQIERLNKTISKNEQYLKNITQISAFMSNSMTALDTVTDHLEQAKNIAIQGSSDTMSPEARQGLASTVDQLVNNLVDLGNTRYKNRYVFGGTLTTDPPFSRTGDTINYAGNDAGVVGKIGFQSSVTYNKSGTEVFNPAGGTDIFQALIDLKQGLENNSTTDINTVIGTLDNALSQVITDSSELGALQNRLSLTEEMIANENINFASALSKTQDTDVAEAIVNHNALENAMTVSLRTMSQAIQTSLADFVG